MTQRRRSAPRTSRTRPNLYADIANGTLPAVSFVKPSGLVDGHPASSKLDLFEGFTKKIVDAVQANPTLWKDTAIFITFDEGGGYYDSGYVQPLDFFGDGTRIPLIVVSPLHASAGHISHDYADHVSILKFIERNWGLQPVTHRSRDNFPNPHRRTEQSLRAGQQPGDRRPVRPVRLRPGSRPALNVRRAQARNFEGAAMRPPLFYWRGFCPRNGRITPRRRGVAQTGRALRLGRRCRRFKSCHPDQSTTVRSQDFGNTLAEAFLARSRS